MTTDFRAEFATFSEAEAEAVFGASSRLKIVPTVSENHRPMTVQEVLRKEMLHLLSALRAPAPRAETIQTGVQWALWFGLLDIEGAYEFRDLPADHSSNPDLDGSVSDAILRTLGLVGCAPQRFLVHAIGEGIQPAADLADAWEETRSPSGFVVDLRALGHRLAEQAGRPLLVLWPHRDIGRRWS